MLDEVMQDAYKGLEVLRDETSYGQIAWEQGYDHFQWQEVTQQERFAAFAELEAWFAAFGVVANLWFYEEALQGVAREVEADDDPVVRNIVLALAYAGAVAR